MERRAFTRQMLFLHAQLAHTRGGTVPCTIRNFCPGGLFLTLEGIPVEVDDSIQVLFNCSLDGNNRDFRLQARVAGKFAGGIGCEFFDPDQEAIRALQGLADRQLAQSAEKNLPAEDTPANAEQLLENCKKCLSDFLAPKLETMFKLADEELFASARDAASNVRTNLYFEARGELPRLKKPVKSAFFDVIIAQMDKLGSPMTAVEEPENEPSSDGLSLLESGQFADWLAAKEIYSRAEPNIRQELYKVEQRLAALSGVAIGNDNNPLSLAVLCQTFHDALQIIASPRLARQAIFTSFDNVVITNLNDLYEELNSFLEQSGVLVDLKMPRPSVVKTPEENDKKPQLPASDAREHTTSQNERVGHSGPNRDQASEPASRSRPSPDLTTIATPGAIKATPPIQETTRPIGRSTGSHSPLDTPIGDQSSAGLGRTTARGPTLSPVDPTANETAPYFSAASSSVYNTSADITNSAYEPEQVKGALPLLQNLEASQPTGELRDSDLKTRITQVLQSQHGSAETKVLANAEQSAIDLIGGLIKSLLSDTLVTKALKPHLGRLEIPLLNVALRDPGFFATEGHRARQIINRFAQIAGTKDGMLEDGIAASVDAIITRIVERSAQDPGVFVESIQSIDQVLGQQATERRTDISNVVRACEEQQALVKSHGGGALSKSSERELPKEWRQWLSRAKRLQVGDAVMLGKNSANPQPGALAWMGENQATYVFVDSQGRKSSTMSLNELAMQLRRGETVVIPEAQLPAMDRGLYDMLKNMHESVLNQARFDALTELINEREFDNRLEVATTEAKRDNMRHALYLMDLDHFHIINDTCGRKAGDRLLKEVGKLLSKTVGGSGEVARLGEDKFGALLRNVSEDRAFEIAEKQRAAIEKFRVTWKGERLQLTLSIGLVGLSGENEGVHAIKEAATLAREKAKSDGGNRIHLYRIDEATTEAEGTSWQPRIEQALKESQLVLRCQNFSPIGDDKPENQHYEILLGVLDDKSEITLPGEFIQAAEIHEKIVEVDRWVIANAFRWMSNNKRKLAHMGGVSIKISEKSLSDEDTLAYVLDQFHISKLPPRKVVFEITENSDLVSLSNAENFIRVLGDYGCRFLLDDFGSGQSSYAYLKHLPFDFVKIDGMFVRNIADSPGDRAMVKSINEIGYFMEKKTIAEFVENDVILDALRDIGIDYAQGFAVGQPFRLTDLT